MAKLHELFIYQTITKFDDTGHAQILPEFKYRSELLPRETQAGEFVTTTKHKTHAQLIPLDVFNEILVANQQMALQQSMIDKVSKVNPLLTKGSDNLAIRAKIVSHDGIDLIEFASIRPTPHPFYYELEQKAENMMNQMHIQPKKMKKQ